MFALKKTAVALDRCNEAVLFIVALLFVMLLRLCEHFPIIPLHPEAYSLPVKRPSNLHLACKTLIYLLAFYFLTKLFLKSPKPMYSFINCVWLLTLQEASWIISRCFKPRPKKKLFYLENICLKIKASKCIMYKEGACDVLFGSLNSCPQKKEKQQYKY